MENMRAVLVIEDAVCVGFVIGVAADMIAPVNQHHARAVLARQPFGEHRAGEAGADDQIIVRRLALGRTEERVHSAATSSAGEAVTLRVPRRSATRPAIRAWVLSQLVADLIRRAAA